MSSLRTTDATKEQQELETLKLVETLAEELHSLDTAMKTNSMSETVTALALIASDARKLCIALKLKNIGDKQ
jgi:hypothetical protein